MRNVKTKVIQVRGHGRRRRKPEGGADWNAIGALVALDGMTEEEELRFLWAHPEVESYNRGMARTEGDRRYLDRTLRR